jgi:EpsI family protein
MLGHISGNKLAAGADHLIYGWAFFGIVIALVFFIGARWREDHVPAHAPAAERAPPAEPVASQPWKLVVALIAAVAAGKIAYVSIEHADAAAPARLAQAAVSGQWHASPQPGGIWRPRFVNPAAESNQVFTDGDTRVGLFIAYYRNQNYTSKLVSSENVLVTTKDPQWAQVKSGSRTIDFNGHTVEVQTAELKGTHDERLVVWRWYWINGHVTASDYKAKALTAFSRLRGQGDDSAAVVAYTRATGPGQAERALESFIGSGASAVSATLVQTRDAR